MFPRISLTLLVALSAGIASWLGAPDASIAAAPTYGAECDKRTDTFQSAALGGSTDANTLGILLNVPTIDRYVIDIDVRANLTGARPEDLDLALLTPDGRRVVLTTDNGGTAANAFGPVAFDDGAAVPVSDASFVSGASVGSVQPEGALGALIGRNPTGQWVLEFTDDTAGNASSFGKWWLDITTCGAAPRTASASVVGENRADVSIPTVAAVATSSIEVSGFGPRAYVCGVSVYTELRHSDNSDLFITVVGPDGASTPLSTANGASNDDIFSRTTWSDSGLEPVTDAVFSNLAPKASLIPEGGFERFSGRRADGTWTLVIDDRDAGNGGVLEGWQLKLETCYPDAAPPALAPEPATVPGPTVTVPGPTVLVPAGVDGSRLTLRKAGARVLGTLTPGAGRAVKLTVQRKVGKAWKRAGGALVAPDAKGGFVMPAAAFGGRAPKGSTFRILAVVAATKHATAVTAKPLVIKR